MATLSATASAAQSRAPAPGPIPGEFTIYGEYTTSASLSVGDVIHMVKVPMGMRITNVSVEVSGNIAGSQFNVDVGDGNATDRFMDSLSLLTGRTDHIKQGLGYLYSAASSTQVDTIDIVPTVASSITSVMTLKLAVKGFMDA
jgi:hypothetical protein